MKRQRAKRKTYGPKVATYRGRRGGTEPVRLLAAGVCVLAGTVLISVRVWGMRFSGFLLLGIAAVLAGSLFLDHAAGGGDRTWSIVRKAFYALVGLGLAAVLCAEGYVVSQGGGSDLPAEAVIVLGAGVNGKTPSLSLRTRLEAALDYLKNESPDAVAILSGGKGYGEEITEARCMYNWLTERGVDPKRLILEEKAESTEENLALSKPLLEKRGVDVKTASVAVVTNDFHIARARMIAQRQGYGETVGVPAALPWRHLSVNYYVREAFGVLAVLTGLDRLAA